MRKPLLMSLAAFVAAGLLPVSLSAQFNRGRGGQRDQVCVYQDVQYQGRQRCFDSGSRVSDLNELRNNVSSVRIFGRARVELYDNRDFRGRAIELTSDVADLGRYSSWNDRADSLQILPESGYGNGRFDPRDDRGRSDRRDNDRYDPRDARIAVCVYENVNYQGRSQCFDSNEEIYDFTRRGNWNDRISSIRIFGAARAMFFRDIQFRGERLQVSRDIPDLGRIGGRSFNWNDQISSAEIQGSFGRGRF